MKTTQRRVAIVDALKNQKEPMSASTLADKFGVSRQIIVGDVAILKAQSLPILSTPRGYLLQEQAKRSYLVACIHSKQDIQKELEIMVDFGGIVENVVVEHPLYGEIQGTLNLASRYDVEQFIKARAMVDAPLLSEMNHGIHLHTLVCKDEQQYERIKLELKKAGFLYE